MTLSPDVLRDGDVLWHQRTGRHVRLSADSLADALAGRAPAVLERLRAEGMLGPIPLDDRVIVRSRRPLLRPDTSSLWFPLPLHPTTGGHAWAEMPLDPVGLALWRAIDDRRRPRDLDLPRDAVLSWLARWTAMDAQIVQLRASPPGPREVVDRLVGPSRPDQVRTSAEIGPAGQTTLLGYHLAIEDGPTHFDDVETTVAHAHGVPHPGLRGRTYGQALAGVLGPVSGTVAEVGCGDGELARDLAPALNARYLRVDLSPNLLATQDRAAPSTSGVLGDATRLPLRDASVDLLVSNEVIADLEAIPWDGAAPSPLPAFAPVRPHQGRAWYNVGAWRFVAEIARVLRPGGRAWLSEFGDPDAAPEEAVQLDHPEVGIHFGQLAAVATAVGLRARLRRLDEDLAFDLHARQLARYHQEGLRAMCRRAGVHWPARAWTPESLAAALPFPVDDLRWVPLSEPGAGPLVTRFWALHLEKP